MILFVDTSVWSLAFRRDTIPHNAEVQYLQSLLKAGGQITTTGLVLQELLQGFAGASAAEAIISRFRAIPILSPNREDHIAAAALRNTCRRSGVQVGTMDAVIVQLCVRHDVELLTTDQDFRHMQKLVPQLKMWAEK